MLDNNDLNQIKDLLDEALNKKEREEKERATKGRDYDYEKKAQQKSDRLRYLQEKYNKGTETLADRIELEKLKLQGKTTDKISDDLKDLLKDTASMTGQGIKNVGQGIKNVGTGALGVAGAAKNSKLGNSLIASIMMSNPITALLYMNSDLIKGVSRAGLGVGKAAFGLGKAGLGAVGSLAGGLLGIGASSIYNLLKGKRKGKGSSKDDGAASSLLPTVNGQEQITTKSAKVLGTNNYIMAKNAMFIGGKNYIIINGIPPMGGAGMFSGPAGALAGSATGLLPGPTKGTTLFGPDDDIPGLPNFKNVTPKESKSAKELSRGIKAIEDHSKKSVELQKKIDSKTGLIILGILLAAAAITTLALWMKKNWNKPIGGNVGPNTEKQIGSFIADTKFSQVNNKIIREQVINKADTFTGNVDSMGYSKKNIDEWVKQGKLSEASAKHIKYNHNQIGKNATMSQYHTENDEKTIISFPVRVNIIEIKTNTDGTQDVTLNNPDKINSGYLTVTKVVQIFGVEYLSKGSLKDKDVIVPANTPFLIVLSGFAIVGNKKSFLNGESDFNTYMNKQLGNREQLGKNFEKYRTDKLVAQQAENEQKELTELSVRSGFANTSIMDLATGTVNTLLHPVEAFGGAFETLKYGNSVSAKDNIKRMNNNQQKGSGKGSQSNKPSAQVINAPAIPRGVGGAGNSFSPSGQVDLIKQQPLNISN